MSIAERRMAAILHHFKVILKEKNIEIHSTLKAEELIKQVLNAEPKKVKESLGESLSLKSAFSNSSVVLIKTDGTETYFSKRKNKLVPKRQWKNISPLQAAALSGDNFLVKVLLNHVPDHLKMEAAQQLKEIRYRADYLAPFKALIKAYQDHIQQIPALHAERNWKKMDALWEEIGEKQKNLPAYGLQEFCNISAHAPSPDYSEEPRRSCVFMGGKELNLDIIGKKTRQALFKGYLPIASIMSGNGLYSDIDKVSSAISLEAAAIEKLVALRTKELDEIIQLLLKESVLHSTSVTEWRRSYVEF
jgi:hypothetical protein